MPAEGLLDIYPRLSGPHSPHNATVSFLPTPIEIQEMIFEHILIGENADNWEWTGDFFGEPGRALCLPACTMRLPILTRVCRQLRANFMAFLCRTTVFRIDIEADIIHFEPVVGGTATPKTYQARHGEGGTRLRNRHRSTSWFGMIRGGDIQIRRLQLRLPKDDIHERRASLNMCYMSKRRQWQVELRRDQGFENGENEHPSSEEQTLPTLQQIDDFTSRLFQLQVSKIAVALELLSSVRSVVD